MTPSGGHLTIRSRNDAESRLILEFTDTGIGFEPESSPTIFDAFEQIENETTSRLRGLGLGLAICRSVIEAHRGTLTATSEGRERGATFVLQLPAVGRPVPSDLKILLVDDDPVARDILERVLRLRGYCVTTADGVVSALSEASGPFDIVISEIDLCDGDALTMMAELTKRDSAGGIVLRAYPNAEQTELGRLTEAGVVAQLTKPWSVEELYNIIRMASAKQDLQGIGSRFVKESGEAS
jgi:CheY-like chemotaxis protein